MITIIGAGPAGLATAYYLQQEGIAYTVLEKGTAGETWRHHYDRLHLHTLKEVSGLPGLPMPADYPRFVPALQFQQYLQEYARHFQLNIQEGVAVQGVTYEPGMPGWCVNTSAGLHMTDLLVMATGIWNTPVQPELPDQAQFGGQIIHATAYRNPQPFVGQRVLVVGVGNSGSELAVDLSENGATAAIASRTGGSFVAYPKSATAMRVLAWLCRNVPASISRPLLSSVRRKFDHLGIPTHPDAPLDYYPVVGYELPEAVAAGQVTVYPGIDHLTPEGARFEDGREAVFDTIIMATGYRPTIDLVAEHFDLDAQGVPLLDEGRSTRNPDLYAVGYQYPVTEGFLQALPREVRSMVSRLAAQARQRGVDRESPEAALSA